MSTIEMERLVSAVTQELSAEVSKSVEPTPEDNLTIQQTALRASELVTHHVGNVSIPNSILALATIEVARELWTHRDAPAGIFTGFGDTAPVRLARDPLRGAYEVLAPFLGAGFA